MRLPARASYEEIVQAAGFYDAVEQDLFDSRHAARMLGVSRRRLYSLLMSHGDDAPE